MVRVVALLALLLPVQAWAHATLMRAEPAVGAVVDDPPSRVVLHFSQGVDTANSIILVVDAHGRPVSQGAAIALADDTLAVPVVLGPGTYKVAWSAVGADGHFSRGSFSFRVR